MTAVPVHDKSHNNHYESFDYTDFISVLQSPNENENEYSREFDAEVASVLAKIHLRIEDDASRKDRFITGSVMKRRRRQKMICYNNGSGIGMTVSDSDDQESLYYYDPPYVPISCKHHSTLSVSYVTHRK
jgi:hypothetical protein